MATGKHLMIAACGVACCLLTIDEASAVPIRFEPGATTVAVGDSLLVDIVISELAGEIVSAYDLDVLYDPGILTATDVIFTPLLGAFDPDPFLTEVFNDFDLSVPGTVDFAQLSFLLDSDLLSLQAGAAGTFTLATIVFDAAASGSSTLQIVLDAFNDVKGLDAAVLPTTTSPGTVTVEEVVQVSEPPVLWLMLAPLGVIAALRRWARADAWRNPTDRRTAA